MHSIHVVNPHDDIASLFKNQSIKTQIPCFVIRAVAAYHVCFYCVAKCREQSPKQCKNDIGHIVLRGNMEGLLELEALTCVKLLAVGGAWYVMELLGIRCGVSFKAKEDHAYNHQNHSNNLGHRNHF